MPAHRRRIRALQAIVAGSVLSGTADHPTIHSELEEVALAGRVRREARRRLLQVLHSTRALDTALRVFTSLHAIPPDGSPSLGGYLRALDRHRSPTLANRLNVARRRHFTTVIVNPRNQFLHEAGVSPADEAALDTLLSEMYACLYEVFAL
jgi:hypothetical protein